MPTIINKKKFQTVIIHKYLIKDCVPNLTTIKQVSGFSTLRKEDIIEMVEFGSSWHILIRREKIYMYEY